jgi:hypothetical protein
MAMEDEIREFSAAICQRIDEDEAYIVSTRFDNARLHHRLHCHGAPPLSSQSRPPTGR